MNFPPLLYTPESFSKVENRYIFDHLSLESALYAAAATNTFPHFYNESEANYNAPILFHKVIQTPSNGMRIITTASIPINPMYGFNANGIWNHVLQVSPDIVVS
jgi:hypothetical protein